MVNRHLNLLVYDSYYECYNWEEDFCTVQFYSIFGLFKKPFVIQFHIPTGFIQIQSTVDEFPGHFHSFLDHITYFSLG